MHKCRLFGAAIMSAAMAAAQPANAQQAPGTSYIITYIEVLPGSQREAASLLRRFGETSRQDRGNLRFETLRRIDRRYHFAILEAWKDEAAAKAHETAAHTKQFHDKLNPLLTAAYDERPHVGLTVGEPQVKVGPRAVFAITHVDIIPTHKDEGIAATKAMGEGGRKESGNLRFDVLQQSSRPNHMTVVEIWRSMRAKAAHSASADMKSYRIKLLPMSGSLYDERLYRQVGEDGGRRRAR
jgi:quinol monooxygenase YgiN